MNVKEVDVAKLSKLISQQVDQITCLECCEYYIAPETALCGHTLCHNCWKRRRTCPVCSKAFDRRQLRVNIPLQRLSDDVHRLKETYQNLFNVKLDEFLLDAVCDKESNKDPTKHVKDWLTSSQNQFSAPVESSESLENQNINQLEVSASNVQIHGATRKTKSHEKVLHVSIPQDDWDKIEPMPDTEDLNKEREKNKENVIGPMDIEPFFFDENEYTLNNPRRSLRNKEIVTNNSMIKTNNNNSLDNISSKDSSEETEKKSNKTKQTWNNVKRMRKEFSKLNKKNKNKLNVSIEMCKKTKNNVKTTEVLKVTPPMYDIDENTPAINIQVPSNAQNTAKETEMPEVPSADNHTKENPTHPAIEKMTIDNEHENSCKLPTAKAKCDIEIKNANITKVPFYKKSCMHHIGTETNLPKMAHNINSNQTFSDDDIQITFRVGNTVTNISIKKKNDSDIKISSDKGIQTSLAVENVATKNVKSVEINSDIKINIQADNDINIEHNNNVINKKHVTLTKSVSEKKNTDSADTATAQFEITESVEKELSSIMECAENNQKQTRSNTDSQKNNKHKEIVANTVVPNTEQELEYLNDLDLFESGSVKEPVQMLKNSNYAASEILVSTVHSKNKTQKASNKRLRVERNERLISQNKKPKLVDTEKIIFNESIDADKDTNVNIHDSEPLNYDSVIGNVFASIDADMKEINSESKKDDNKMNVEKTEAEKSENQKESENLFSVYIVDKDNDEDEGNGSDLMQNNEAPIVIETHTEDFLTPVTSHNVVTNTGKSKGKEGDVDCNDDSESVVEETPQKNSSIPKYKQKSNEATGIRELNGSQKTKSDLKKTSVVELSDTSEMKNSKNITVIETAKRGTLETPLNINKFVDQIKHKSTPVARKSLNFNHENDDDTDPEQTLCPTNDQIAKTTQEKEFLRKAFEKTPVSMVRPLKSHSTKSKKLCIAGSCLSSSEDMKLKLFCSKHNFTYVDRYTKELTHLVVGVDEENKSQRSVKYMCALAASKWIVSYKWIEKCLETNDVVNEERFEVLDSTGDPGPMRSRLSKKKLFHGIAFYCFGPFSVLDEHTLKMMLEAAGGLVVKEVQEIKVTARKGPALLLAEPENTQEDRFIYLAMDLSIVPVNFEWVLNCLGSYTLTSIHELLLCPSSILHKNVQKWPQELIAQEDD